MQNWNSKNWINWTYFLIFIGQVTWSMYCVKRAFSVCNTFWKCNFQNSPKRISIAEFYLFSGGTGLLYAVHFHLSNHLVCLSLHSNCHVLEQIIIAMHVRPLWSVMLQKTKNFSQIDKIPNHWNANARDARTSSPAGHWAATNPNQSVIDNCTKFLTKRL